MITHRNWILAGLLCVFPLASVWADTDEYVPKEALSEEEIKSALTFCHGVEKCFYNQPKRGDFAKQICKVIDRCFQTDQSYTADVEKLYCGFVRDCIDGCEMQESEK